MSCCFKFVVSFNLILVSGVTGLSLTQESLLTDRTAELEGPPQESDDAVLRRSKRFSQDEIFLRPNTDRIKFVPDFQTGTPPSPGPSLDSSIFESNGDVYRGLHLRLTGEKANLNAPNKIHRDEISKVESSRRMSYDSEGNPWKIDVYSSLANDDVESLKMVQAEVNRRRLEEHPRPASNIILPPIAQYYDPNILMVPHEGYRRMMDHTNSANNLAAVRRPPHMPTFTLPQGAGVIGNGGVYYLPALRQILKKPKEHTPAEMMVMSPLEVLREKFGTTTSRSYRTRRPKTTTTLKTDRLMSIQEDEYFRDESGMEDNVTSITLDLPDEAQMDEGEQKTDAVKFDSMDLKNRIRTFNASREKYMEDMLQDMPEYKERNKYQPKTLNGPENNNNEDTTPDFLPTMDVEAYVKPEFDDTSYKDSQLVKELKALDSDKEAKTLEISKETKTKNEQKLKAFQDNLKRTDVPLMNVGQRKDMTDAPISRITNNNHPQGPHQINNQKKKIKMPMLFTDSEGEINSDIKTILESTLPKKSDDAEYDEDDEEEIKGIPIHKRRNVKNK